eukprot:COSAG01_NODE_14613_length_1431_cov_1.464366_3_plen_60_part_01
MGGVVVLRHRYLDLPPPRTIQGEAAKQMLAEQYGIGAETIREVSLKRLPDESPWSQFSSE